MYYITCFANGFQSQQYINKIEEDIYIHVMRLKINCCLDISSILYFIFVSLCFQFISVLKRMWNFDFVIMNKDRKLIVICKKSRWIHYCYSIFWNFYPTNIRRSYDDIFLIKKILMISVTPNIWIGENWERENNEEKGFILTARTFNFRSKQLLDNRKNPLLMLFITID